MKKRNFWLILIALLLVACGEPSVTARPTTLAPPASPARSFQIADQGTPTAGLIVVTPAASATAGPIAPTTSPPSIIPATTAIPSTATPAPTATPVPFQLSQQQIGLPRCCQAFAFAQDGRLYFYDKPVNAPRPATYSYDLASGQQQLLSNRFGFFSADLKLVAVSDRATGLTTIEQVSDGTRRATLQNQASSILFSPDQTRLAYLLRSPNQAGSEAPQLFSLWTGQLDGSGLRSIWDLREGDNLAWFGDSRHLLLTARNAANTSFGLWVIDTQAAPGQNANLIVESKGLIAASVSADGAYVVYAITLQGEANSGVWLARTNGGDRHKFDWQGGWRWVGQELFFIPNRVPGETASSLSVYDPATHQATRLTDPTILPLQITGDQWEIAPDSKNLVYRGTDNALWLLHFRP